MSNARNLDGGCLCGAVRYAVEGGIEGAAHCHCTLCRRASGAAALTWFWVESARFHVTKGELALYRSSAHGERGFCSRCGTPITFRSDQAPDSVDVTLGSLDDPEPVRPSHHVWTGSRLSWLHLDEALPDHVGGTPGDGG